MDFKPHREYTFFQAPGWSTFFIQTFSALKYFTVNGLPLRKQSERAKTLDRQAERNAGPPDGRVRNQKVLKYAGCAQTRNHVYFIGVLAAGSQVRL